MELSEIFFAIFIAFAIVVIISYLKPPSRPMRMTKGKVIYPLVILFVLSSCGRTQVLKYVCDCKQQQKVAEFIHTNLPASNNMSDEEMEDVISQLYLSGVATSCSQRIFTTERMRSVVDWSLPENKLDSCEMAVTPY